MPANVYMICGLTGAGKTTYAEQLRLDVNGVRMSIDDWMANLFFMDRDPASDFQWFHARVRRCCAQMRDTANQVIENGKPVVLDCGFTNLEEREIFYDWADGMGFSTALHFVDVPEQIRWDRVQNRNAEKGDTFALEVTRDMFDFMNRIWQAPTEVELQNRNGVIVEN
ncbi:MAG: ATP-binding protein [Paracoccaceae bacterium]|jgi:predicted kinase|nr:ATP-binding protein [Paracoccaceae bacterium]